MLFLCWSLGPRTLYFVRDSYDFILKKRCTVGGHFSSLWEPHVARTLFFMKDFDDFWCFVWAPQKCPKNARVPKMHKNSFPAPQDGLKSTSLGPDSTGSYTPIRTCTLKRFANPKPPRYLKVSFSAIYGLIRPYLPYTSRQRKKRAQPQVDHGKCLLLACL